MVSVTYDEQANAMYLSLSKNRVARTLELKRNQVIIDLDENDFVVGIELIDVEEISNVRELLSPYKINKTLIQEELERLRGLETVFA